MFALKVLWTIFVLCAILFIAYVSTRYLSNKANKAMKGKYINIVESVSIGLDKQLVLVKAGEEFVLMACSGKSVTFLTTVKVDDYQHNDGSESADNVFDFKVLFEKYVQNFRTKKNNVQGGGSKDSANTDVFRNNLSKLRSINAKMDGQSKEDGDDNTNEM